CFHHRNLSVNGFSKPAGHKMASGSDSAVSGIGNRETGESTIRVEVNDVAVIDRDLNVARLPGVKEAGRIDGNDHPAGIPIVCNGGKNRRTHDGWNRSIVIIPSQPDRLKGHDILFVYNGCPVGIGDGYRTRNKDALARIKTFPRASRRTEECN